VRRYLQANEAWSEEGEREIEEAESQAVEDAVTEAEALTAFDAGEIFDGMFAEVTGPLQAQRDESTGAPA
jgi:TPP-dependent pyruvate/acetoin dehydrogenase alpha subunit